MERKTGRTQVGIFHLVSYFLASRLKFLNLISSSFYFDWNSSEVKNPLCIIFQSCSQFPCAISIKIQFVACLYSLHSNSVAELSYKNIIYVCFLLLKIRMSYGNLVVLILVLWRWRDHQSMLFLVSLKPSCQQTRNFFCWWYHFSKPQ